VAFYSTYKNIFHVLGPMWGLSLYDQTCGVNWTRLFTNATYFPIFVVLTATSVEIQLLWCYIVSTY